MTAPVTRTESGRPPTNILLVDDRNENLVALRAILEPLQQNLVAVRSGEEALRRLLQSDFAVILLDVQMPGMDGFETATLIKQRERSRHIPIIFLTAISKESEHVFRGYESGAVDYMFKPFDPWILRSKVSVFIELSQRKEQIARQAAQLEKANQELKKLDRLKSRFVAMAAHELRTPMTSIGGFSSTMLNRWTALSDEDKHHFVEIIDSEAERLVRLINNLLTLSRITSGAVEAKLEQIEMRSVIERAVESIGGKEVEVTCPGHLRALADYDHVNQILLNYITNAMKYGSEPIEVRARERGEWVEVAVADSGRGIDPQFRPLLFQEFSQAEQTADEEGTGLGLAIVRRLADAQGGEVFYEPNEPQGSVFGVRLPKAMQPADVPAPASTG